MENYFKCNGNTPLLFAHPKTGKSINIEPMITAMFELADDEHRDTPQGLGIIISEAIRHLATNVTVMEKEELVHYRKMISQLYELQDMFEAMSITQ